MIIDTHTHCFPDALAKRAIENITKGFPGFSDVKATFGELISNLDNAGIDKAFLLNIATNPRQQDNVNAFSLKLNNYNGRIYSFGSVHPAHEDIRGSVRRVKESGLYGIKLHPDYQGYDIDSPEYRPIFAACCEEGFPVVIHSGFDPQYPSHIHATPKMVSRVISDFPGLILVCAHFCSNGYLYDDVLKYLCGKDIWFDTAFQHTAGSPPRIKEIIASHDENKIMFGSDTPWEKPSDTLSFIDGLGLPAELKEKILHRNAENFISKFMTK